MTEQCTHEEVISNTYDSNDRVLTLRCIDCGAVIPAP